MTEARSVRGTLMSWSASLALAVVASTASAQTTVTVTLQDGSQYQGDLVEKVPNDRVVIKLATGEIKTFLWTDIASTTESQGAGSAATTSTSNANDLTGDGTGQQGSPNAQQPPSTIPDTRMHLALGAITTIPEFPSPVGVAGLALELQVPQWRIAMELASGYDGLVSGGNLGWATKETVRSTLLGFLGVGGGLSEHLGAAGAGVLVAAHVELTVDLLVGDFLVRVASGWAPILNAADHPGAAGSFGQGGSFFYVDLELLYRIGLGPLPQKPAQG